MSEHLATSNQTESLEALEHSLPSSQGDARVIALAQERQEHLRAWMLARGLQAVLISRRDHFAWLTAGGDNRVLENSEYGFGHLLVTPGQQYLLAHSMDARRLLAEQVPGQGYELVELRWYEGDPRQRALELVQGRVGADSCLLGADEIVEDLNKLHFPLDALEIERLRWLARRTGDLLVGLGYWVQPGMAETEIAREMRARFARAGIDLDVVIVGSDERISKYRHPLPTNKHVENYVLLHPAARRWGLHANVSRSLYFGEVPQEIRRAYTAAATVQARVLAGLRPGRLFTEILEDQKRWYAELGYPGEWKLHFQGGPTAYQVVDATRCLGDTRVQPNQSFDWFITVTGAKVEELSLLVTEGAAIESFWEGWPGLEILAAGKQVTVPDLWVRSGSV